MFEIRSGFLSEELRGVAIPRRDKAIGVLIVRGKRHVSFTPQAISLLQSIATSASALIERHQLRIVMDEIGTPNDVGAVHLDETLERILEETMNLGFELASVSLVDDFQNRIVMVRGRNVAPGWQERSRYPLSSGDIQPWIVREKKSRIIEGAPEEFLKGPDPLLNPDISARFEHESMTRIWVPILHNGTVAGTISAGVDLSRTIFVYNNQAALERVAEKHATEVARNRPEILLKGLAEKIVQLTGADGASIHVERHDGLSMVAGAGGADIRFLRDNRPRPDGVGAKAQSSAGPILLAGEALRERNPVLYERERVRAQAVFALPPLENATGTLYIHRLNEQQFDNFELSIARALAKSVQVVIRNYFFLYDASVRLQQVWALTRLQGVIQQLSSNFDLERLLEEVTRIVLYHFDAESVLLYQRDGGQPARSIVIKGSGASAWRNRTIYSEEQLVRLLNVAGGIQGHQQPVRWARTGRETPPEINSIFEGNSFLEEQKIDEADVIALRSATQQSGVEAPDIAQQAVGLLILHHRERKRFVWDAPAVNALASSAALAIQTARISNRWRQDLARRQKELEVIRDVAGSIAKFRREEAIRIEEFAGIILEKALTVIGADVGAVMWYSAAKDALESKGLFGLARGRPDFFQPLDIGVLGNVAESRQPILLDDVSEYPKYKPVVEGMRSELAVPILFGQKLLGIYYVGDRQRGKFTIDDQLLLQSVSSQAIAAWHLADLKTELSEQDRPWRALGYLAAYLQNPENTFDAVLRLILTGLTAGEGLGYTRALLFLYDENEDQVVGQLAVGDQTQQAADEGWDKLNIERKLADPEDSFDWILKRAVNIAAAVRKDPGADGPLSLGVRTFRSAKETLAGALGKCWKTGKIQLVAAGVPDPFRELLASVSAGDRGKAFACVPLVDNKVMGAIFVDNRFRRDLEDEDISPQAEYRLVVFAEVAELTIRNALLRRKTIQDYQDLIHQLKAPLRSAAWYAARLALPAGEANFAEEIVTKLRAQCARSTAIASSIKLMADITAGDKIQVKEEILCLASVHEMIFSALPVHEPLTAPERGIKFRVKEDSLEQCGASIRADVNLLEQAFSNLLDNASKYCADGGEISISVLQYDGQIAIAFTNPSDCTAEHEIPLVTRRGWRSDSAKASFNEGGGIGLYLVKQIIEAMRGRLEVSVQDGNFTASLFFCRT